MTDDNDIQTPRFDVIVIGAGPAGCEASMASARAGSSTLCLAISLDNTGFPPANPIIAEGGDDLRFELIEEVRSLGGWLPAILADDSIATRLDDGTLLADRRRLGLAYKELLETTDGVYPRQSLVTGVEPVADGWLVSSKLGERFRAGSLIVAAGTFLEGEVDDGGAAAPGGRLGEIPAKALAGSLRSLGIRLAQIESVNMPRLGAGGLALEPRVVTAGGYRLFPDGSQLGERYMHGPYVHGNRASQLETLRRLDGLSGAWMTRPSHTVRNLSLASGQVDIHLESVARPGLFFAGRAAGVCNYTESAATGLVSGLNAHARSRGMPPACLTKDKIHVTRLCERVAERDARPVTIRTEGDGC